MDYEGWEYAACIISHLPPHCVCSIVISVPMPPHALAVLEVIRTTPLGLVTGRDYYMASTQVEVADDLQFQLSGIIRSYNALFPVVVIAGWPLAHSNERCLARSPRLSFDLRDSSDFVAKRRPGRFVREADEDEAEK